MARQKYTTWILLAILGVALYLVFIKPGGIPSFSVAGGQGTTPPQTVLQCQEGTGYTIYASLTNGQRTGAVETIDGRSYEFDSTAGFKKTGTTTAGAGALTSISGIPCLERTGTLHFLQDANFTGLSIPIDGNTQTTYVKVVANNSRVRLNFRDNGYGGNVTCDVGSTGATQPVHGSGYSINYSSTTDLTCTGVALGVGQTLNFYLDMDVNSTSREWGSLGGYIACNFPDLTKFSVNALTFTTATGNVQVQKVSCPADVATARQAQACWSVSKIGSSSGLVRLAGSLTADIGEPAAASSPTCYVIDTTVFRDTDNAIKTGNYDAAGTDLGVVDSIFKITVT